MGNYLSLLKNQRELEHIHYQLGQGVVGEIKLCVVYPEQRESPGVKERYKRRTKMCLRFHQDGKIIIR